MELSQETTQPADHTLRDAIAELIYGTSQESVERPWGKVTTSPVLDDAYDTADQVIALLVEAGHFVPGAPPAAQILADAKSFAEQLILSNLALRILNMLAWAHIETPETKPARRFIEDYLEGKNHGPVGKAMLWPVGLPGLAHLLRDWGFEPTATTPAFVARSAPKLTMQ